MYNSCWRLMDTKLSILCTILVPNKPCVTFSNSILVEDLVCLVCHGECWLKAFWSAFKIAQITGLLWSYGDLL